MYIVTGKTGEPHVTGADDAAFNAGVFGNGDFILSNTTFKATMTAPGQIKLDKAEIVMGGVHGRITGSEVLTINSAAQGKKRIDTIVARYRMESNGLESMEVAVVQGTPVDSDPVAPALNEGNIYAGAEIHEMALVNVLVETVNITKIDVVAKKAKTVGDIDEALNRIASLESKLNTAENAIKTANTNINTVTAKANTNATNITNIQNATKDSGWVNIPVQGTGVTVGTQPKVRKVGHVVHIAGTIAFKGYTGDANIAVATIPVGYRPTQGFYKFAPTNNDMITRFIYTTDGRIQIEWARTAAGAKYAGDFSFIDISATYIV